MYSNTAPEAGSRVVVRCVPLLGPPYLRKGSRICGKTVGRSCLFVLITFGVASLMIGVVLFTADLQMVTGFWAVGIVLFTVGFLMVFSFIVLCCVARRTYNSLPANHPQRSKQFRPSTTLPAHTSSYQLLPMRQPVSYISPPGMQTVDSYPLAHGGQAVAYSTLRGGGGGGIGGGAASAAAEEEQRRRRRQRHRPKAGGIISSVTHPYEEDRGLSEESPTVTLHYREDTVSGILRYPEDRILLTTLPR
ncbi:uncharacterized protein [Panulirus ornatus]|uniref:uncharacterized protein isoform X2 n=1 Tax=Panulirus ornatus TaxID=150431 RepID=UPI003A8ACD0E